jgi:hypothetical protein
MAQNDVLPLLDAEIAKLKEAHAFPVAGGTVTGNASEQMGVAVRQRATGAEFLAPKLGPEPSKQFLPILKRLNAPL